MKVHLRTLVVLLAVFGLGLSIHTGCGWFLNDSSMPLEGAVENPLEEGEQQEEPIPVEMSEVAGDVQVSVTNAMLKAIFTGLGISVPEGVLSVSVPVDKRGDEVPGKEDCETPEDDDRDGLTNCDDPDCAGYPTCSICGDGTCEGDETAESCPRDCFEMPDFLADATDIEYTDDSIVFGGTFTFDQYDKRLASLAGQVEFVNHVIDLGNGLYVILNGTAEVRWITNAVDDATYSWQLVLTGSLSVVVVDDIADLSASTNVAKAQVGEGTLNGVSANGTSNIQDGALIGNQSSGGCTADDQSNTYGDCVETNCGLNGDISDDDFDGMINCCDPDCEGKVVLVDSIGTQVTCNMMYYKYVDGVVTAPSDSEGECWDNQDYDCNGLADCDDPWCAVSLHCDGAVCGDGIRKWDGAANFDELCDESADPNGCQPGQVCIDCLECVGCGDHICQPEIGEDPETCPEDCFCGDGVLSDLIEGCDLSAGMDLCEFPEICNPIECICTTCGNGQLDDGEECDLSAGARCDRGDCNTLCQCVECGDRICEEGEDAFSCPADCPPVCPNDMCEPGEDSCTCPEDCAGGCCGNGIIEYDWGEECEADEDCGEGQVCNECVCESAVDCGFMPVCVEGGDAFCEGVDPNMECDESCGCCVFSQPMCNADGLVEINTGEEILYLDCGWLGFGPCSPNNPCDPPICPRPCGSMYPMSCYVAYLQTGESGDCTDFGFGGCTNEGFDPVVSPSGCCDSCGNGVVEPEYGEDCESDQDCGQGETCNECACESAASPCEGYAVYECDTTDDTLWLNGEQIPPPPYCSDAPGGGVCYDLPPTGDPQPTGCCIFCGDGICVGGLEDSENCPEDCGVR